MKASWRRRLVIAAGWAGLAAGCAGLHRAGGAAGPVRPQVTLRTLMRDTLDPCVKRLQPIALRDSMTSDDYRQLDTLARELEDGAYRIADVPPANAQRPLEEYFWHGGILVARANELRWACARENVEGVRLALSAVVQSCNACHAKFRKDSDGYASY